MKLHNSKKINLYKDKIYTFDKKRKILWDFQIFLIHYLAKPK
ncbi:hypothetical protein FLAVO9AF_170101 [Flavobacterium sp. 9AF]|nr:hypothetical protein FLAVO9AF_170101 [Flavobacterium sp. 9AF]